METAFGIVPIQRGNPQKVILVQKQDGTWGFPKGHSDGGETDIETALRELKEETGIILSESDLITDKILTEEYWYQRDGKDVQKQVIYFLGFVETIPVFSRSDEIADRALLPIDEALSRLTYDESKNILRMATKLADNLPVESVGH